MGLEICEDTSVDKPNKPYPRDVDNFHLKMAENHYLAKAFAENSPTDLQQFAILRQARGRIIGDLIQQEALWETEFGLPEYIRLMALNQTSRQKFVEEAEGHMRRLRDVQSLFDMPLMSRSVGCVLCLTMKSLGINFEHEPGDAQTLFEMLPKENSAVQAACETYYGE